MTTNTPTDKTLRGILQMLAVMQDSCARIGSSATSLSDIIYDQDQDLERKDEVLAWLDGIVRGYETDLSIQGQRIEALEEALAPFAAIAQQFDNRPGRPNSGAVMGWDAGSEREQELTVEHLRAARAVLSTSQEANGACDIDDRFRRRMTANRAGDGAVMREIFAAIEADPSPPHHAETVAQEIAGVIMAFGGSVPNAKDAYRICARVALRAAGLEESNG